MASPEAAPEVTPPVEDAKDEAQVRTGTHTIQFSQAGLGNFLVYGYLDCIILDACITDNSVRYLY